MPSLLKELRRTQSHVNWLIPVSATEWHLVRNHLSYGVPPGHRAKQRISVDDILLFYVPKKAKGDLGGKLVGVFQVVSDWSEISDENLDEQIQPEYPIRVELRWIKDGQADFWKLSKRLSFVTRKSNASFYLQGTPANFNRPIPESDLKLIMTEMNKPAK